MQTLGTTRSQPSSGDPPGRRHARKALLAFLVAVFAATLFPLLPAAPASAATCPPTDPTCNLTYRIRTKSGFAAAREVEARIGQPVLVDAYSDSQPDLLVQLMATTGSSTGLTFTVRRLTTSSWRVTVEAILAVPDKPGEFVAFGYDASECGNPATFTEAIQITPIPGRTLDVTAVVDVETPQACLAPIASLFREDAARNRIDPLTVSLRQAPVALRTTAQFYSTPEEHYWAAVTPSTPTVLSPAITRVKGNEETRVTATVDQLPVSGAVLNYYKQDSKVIYGSQSPVGSLSVDVRRLTAGKLDTHVTAALRNVPATTFTFNRTGDTGATFSSTLPIGTVEYGVGTTGSPVAGPATGDYFKIWEKDALKSVSGRLTGLTSANVSWAEPLRVQVKKAAAPFDIITDTHHRKGCTIAGCWDIWRTARIAVRDLPADVTFSYSLTSQTLTYAGSAGIGEIKATVADPQGLGSLTTRVEALLRQVPTNVNVTVPPAGRGVSVDASAPIGLVELLATNGPDERIANNVDGVLIRDRQDRKVKFVRVKGLQRAVIDAGAVIHLDVTKDAAQRFVIDSEETRVWNCETCIRDIDVTIDWLPKRVVLDFNPATQALTYNGSDPISVLTASLSDPTGLLQKQPHPVRKAHLFVQSLPKSVTFTATPGTENIAIDTTAPIGYVGLKLTSGPDEHNLPHYGDGVRVDDMIYYFSAHVRLTGLQKAELRKTKTCTDFGHGSDCVEEVKADLKAEGGRYLHVQLYTGYTGRTVVSVENHAPHITLESTKRTWSDIHGVIDKETRTKVTASRASGALQLDTNTRDRDKRITLDRVPAQVNLCSSEDSGVCNGSSRRAEQGSVSFVASEPVTLSMRQCTSQDCSSYIDIPSLTLRRLNFELNVEGKTDGEARIDTDNEPLHGNIRVVENREDAQRITFPQGFRAQDRFVWWDPFPSAVGSIHCPPGVVVDVKVLWWWVNVAGFLC